MTNTGRLFCCIPAVGNAVRSTQRIPSLATATAGGRGPFAAVQSTLASGGAETPSGANTLSVPIAFAVRSPLGSTVSITYVFPGSTIIANQRVCGYVEKDCCSAVPSATKMRLPVNTQAGQTEAIAAPMSRMPAPQYCVVPPTPARLLVQSRPVPVGNARAVDWMIADTCAGVSAGLSPTISETTPVTWGVAMLVP